MTGRSGERPLEVQAEARSRSDRPAVRDGDEVRSYGRNGKKNSQGGPERGEVIKIDA